MQEIILSGIKKIKAKEGTEIHIKHDVFKDNKTHLHIMDISANHNGIFHNHRITIGAVDGKRVPVSLDDIQKSLDDYRQHVANEVEWKSNVADIVRQLK